jgi:YYY domain-containing protein
MMDEQTPKDEQAVPVDEASPVDDQLAVVDQLAVDEQPAMDEQLIMDEQSHVDAELSADEQPPANLDEPTAASTTPPPDRGRLAGLSSTTLTLIALGAILAVAAYFRLIGVDWDAGNHLHPDERFLTMVQGSLSLPLACQAPVNVAPVPADYPTVGRDWYGCLLGYLDTDTSPMNPRNTGHTFYSYGTWAMTLIHLVARPFAATDYNQVYLIGRKFSAVLDLLSLILLFAVGARLYDRRVGLLAAALGAGTAFFIQQSHFMTVDGPATFFVMVFFFGAAGLVRGGRWRWLNAVIAGIGIGMALATKIAVWPLAPVAVIVLAAEAWRRGNTRQQWLRAIGEIAVIGVIAFIALRLSEPTMFAGPGWPNVVESPDRLTAVTAGQWIAPEWWHTVRNAMPDALEPLLLPDPRWADSMHRISGQVTGYGMDWPPNHQWWGRTDYLFPWQNMVLWGMGLALGITAWLGWGLAAYEIFWRRRIVHLLPWLWITFVFLYYGGQWGKTMRYFLPIYPALILLAAYLLFKVWDSAKEPEDVGRPSPSPNTAGGGGRGAGGLGRKLGAGALIAIVLGGTLLWGFMVSRLYSRDHSRVAASKWVYHNLPTTFGLTVKDPESGDYGPGRYLPVTSPGQLRYEIGTSDYLVSEDGWVGPGKVIVPGDKPVTIDGAQLNFVTDPAGDAGDESFRVVLAEGSTLDDQGGPGLILAEGTARVKLDETKPQTVAVDLPETVLQPGGEYNFWARVTGAPVSGRPARLAHHTTWDDTVPMGLYGYGPWDEATTEWGEGMFGYVELQLYAEDRPDKLDTTIESLKQADYTIATSNRVYGSVAQMPTRFPMTIALFNVLFGQPFERDRLLQANLDAMPPEAGEAERQSVTATYDAAAESLAGKDFGIKHVADIHSYPNLGPWEVNDQPAEEAWHVYDHPRVDIWDVSGMDAEGLRTALAPLTTPEIVTWQWPTDDRSIGARLRKRLPPALAALLPGGAAGDGSGTVVAEPTPELPPEFELPEVIPASAVMLSAERREAERTRADYIFNLDSVLNQNPALAVLVWYLTLLLVGLFAFPIVASALRNLSDRGWAVARTAGLLITSWLAWLVSSLGWVDHTPALVWAAAAVMGLLSLLLLWRGRNDASGSRFPLLAWMRANKRLLVTEELVFLALFAVFLAIRTGNPDLWHPYYGGEKPMDFAYLNAVLRSVSFPPLDPWFAGGQLNYYYFGFVFIGALFEMTGIVPWIGYNLAIPTLAALTGMGVFGVVFNWVRAGHRAARVAAAAGGLGAVLAVLSGNLFQVPFILQKLAELSPSTFESELPGIQNLVRALPGWWAVARGEAALNIPTGHWYWNASRAIPDGSITEMPFFTFLYADLHAHMMALPITVLALMVALSWAVLTEEERLGINWPLELWGLGRLVLGALAIGALWPANTWDFPTYGLVAAGAIAAGQWQRSTGRGWRRWLGWALGVALRGGVLLGLSLLFFLPYHQAYVTPYASFRGSWDLAKTTLEPYLIIHGIFLFAMVTWILVRLTSALGHRDERGPVLRAMVATAALSALVLGGLWWKATSEHTAIGNLTVVEPSMWVPLLAGILLTLGVPVLVRPRARAPERFAAWVFVLGVLLTQFVEYVVLDGDIGRMNTVFKFYIQVWTLWATLAAVSVAWLRPTWRLGSRSPWSAWAPAWRVVFAGLVVCGLVYTITAARAKMQDRFPASFGMDPAEREGYEARNFKPGLSGIAYQDYATYDEAQPGGANRTLLRLADDRDAFMWLLRNVRGSPTILEAYNINGGYRWGSRYSIYTGLPAVIGWDWHQKQQRNGVEGGIVDVRTRDVGEMYNNPDFEAVRSLFELYDVEYVIVGDQERVFYDAAGLAKFDALVESGEAERVYTGGGTDDQPAVIIYRLNRPQPEASVP